MYFIKQDDFDSFKCIADKCPSSCCKVWQIVIDDEAMDLYEALPGEPGEKIRAGIDKKEGVFKQCQGNCSMLGSDELCNIQREFGEEALCYTCRTYPRHVEEFEDIREFSLSISCPEVARMVVEKQYPLSFDELEVDEEDDFEEFDFLLFTKLCDAREVIFSMIYDEENDLVHIMGQVLEFASQLQECLDEGRLYDMDHVIEDWANAPELATLMPGGIEALAGLEVLDLEWKSLLDKVLMVDRDELQQALLHLTASEDMAARQLLATLTYTYFCGAVYDDCIYTKAALIVKSVEWIFEIYGVYAEGKSEKDKLVEVVYRYAREVEHSDLNLDALEEYFEQSKF